MSGSPAVTLMFGYLCDLVLLDHHHCFRHLVHLVDLAVAAAVLVERVE